MNIAILLAAGKGLRLKSATVPKQYLIVNRKPLYRYSLDTFIAHKQINHIVLVVEEPYFAKVESEIRPLQKKKPIHLVVGGATRQASSFQALKYIQKKLPETAFVFIHDVARPLISSELIDQVADVVKKHYAVTLGLPIHSSVISSNQGDLIDNYIPRQQLFLAQTPQAFHFPTIYEAHQTAIHQNISSATDDASLIKIMNKEVKIINGSRLNFKITHDDDLALLKAILLP